MPCYIMYSNISKFLHYSNWWLEDSRGSSWSGNLPEFWFYDVSRVNTLELNDLKHPKILMKVAVGDGKSNIS